MRLKKWFIGLVIGLITILAQAATQEKQLELALTYNEQAIQFYQQGEFGQALPLAEEALKIAIERLGEKHADTLIIWNNLALIYAGVYNTQVIQYYQQGKFQQALPLAEKAFKIRNEILGEKHPDTLTSLNTLALIYQNIGRLFEALPLFKKGYRLTKEVLGEKHPDTLISLNNLTYIHTESLKLAETYNNQVVQFYQQGQFEQALPLAEEALKIRIEILGEKHPNTLQSMNNLALIYQNIGWLSEALPLSEKNYRLTKEVLGEKHPSTLRSLNNLAGIYQTIGQLSEALPLFEKSYRLHKEVLGEKHPDTLGSLNNLALIYQALWQLSEALPLSEKSYRLHKEVLGEKHPDTLGSLNNLALIYQVMGRLSEALPLSEKTYRLTKEVLGEKHPFTLRSLNNLALIYQAIGQLSEALPLSEKGYRLSKEVLGEKHPSTLLSLNNLATIYKDIGQLSEALPLFEKGYRLHKEILGEKHPDTLTSLNNLAFIYQDLGWLSEALPLFEKGYRLTKEVLGEKHPNTLKSLNNLAFIYHEMGWLSEALPLFEKGYRLKKEVLGKKHPDTLTSLNNLAEIYRVMGRLSEALPLSEKNYRLTKEVLGEKHPNTLRSMNNLANIYQNMGWLSEALPLYEKSYRYRAEVLGERHPSTLTSLNNLAEIYQDIGRLSEALPLYEKSYRLYKEVLGEKHPETLSSLNNLALIYQALWQLSEALLLSEKGYRLTKEVLGEKHPDTLNSLNNLALIYQYSWRLSEALPLYEKSYRLSKEVLGEKHPNTLDSLSNLASIYDSIGRLSEALPLHKKCYRLTKEVLGEKHPDTLNSLTNLAYIYQAQGKIDKAIKQLEKLVEGVEHLRSGDLSAENRQALFKKWVPGYFDLSRLYIEQSRFQDAFRLAEMSKARTLLESLAAKHAARQSGLTKTEQQQLQDYDMRLADLNNQIGKALQDNRLDDRVRLETDKNQLINKLNKFHRELMAKYPKYARLSEVQIISAQEGAKYLPKNAVLISYLVNNNHVLAFTLQSDGKLTAHDLGEIPDLSKDLETYKHRLTSFTRTRGAVEPLFSKPPELKTTNALSLKLGKYLLEPLKGIIKDKPHWIISPNGPLATIAFETLRFENDKSLVIAQHQISYVQSLSILAQLQKREKNYKRLKNRGTLLAMGAPLYEKTTATSNPNTTDFANQMVRRGGDYSGALRQLNLKWKNLPGALDELLQLEKLFFLKKHRSRVYKQADATEAKLQHLNKFGILAKYRYLVFAAHGYLSSEVPALSSIVLGQVNNPPDIDGYVTAGEWPSYDLKSDLMVLSACETGLGKNIGGEGVIGLPYALYVAGNKNTLLTLWTISDKATTKFITSFFKKLKAGMGQIEALTATKREFLRDKKLSSPLYWAAFVLYGV
jgi:tetratricopeptide (TPR) repeat protein